MRINVSDAFLYFCEVENLINHIVKLLKLHEYVVVPGLGGFVTQPQSAALLPDRISPPRFTIGFNPLMQHGDGMLAIEVARELNISYREANKYIATEVAEIISHLNNYIPVKLPEIGELNKSLSGEILFTPKASIGILPCNFGLNDIRISEINTKNQTNRKTLNIPLPSTQFYRYMAAAILFFGLMFISPNVTNIGQADTANLSSLSFINSPIISAPELSNNDTIKNDSSTTINPKDYHIKYHIIVASWKSKKMAEKFCSELAADFNTAHVISPANAHYVAIQSFANRDTAIQQMEKLRMTDSRFETAWVRCE